MTHAARPPRLLMVLAAIAGLSACAGMGSPSAYKSDLSYVMFVRGLGATPTYEDIAARVAADCSAIFNRGPDWKYRIWASWSGECKNGLAEGPGTMRFRELSRPAGGERIDATVVEGEAKGGKCVRGTVTSTDVTPALKLSTIRFVKVFPCGDEKGAPRAFMSYPSGSYESRFLGQDEFTQLSALSIDFIRSSFPEYHMKGITYNPKYTASAIVHSTLVGLNTVAEAALPVVEPLAVQKRVNKAQAEINKANQGEWTYAKSKQKANATNARDQAVSDGKALQAIADLAPQYVSVNARFLAASKTVGTRAEDGRLCLHLFDEVRTKGDRTLQLPDRGENKYINLCENVRIDVFTCLYQVPTDAAPAPPLDCFEKPEDTLGFKRRYSQELFLDPDNGKHTTHAFCPSGSRPAVSSELGNNQASHSTQRNGRSTYKCAWV